MNCCDAAVGRVQKCCRSRTGWQTSKRVFGIVSLATLLAMSAAVSQAQTATVTVQANQPGAQVSSNLFGLFFEEINSAGDGGIYGERVRNRSFEDSADPPAYWTLLTNGTASGQMKLDSSMPLSSSNLHCLALTKTGGSGSVSVANAGYWGIPVASSTTYNLEFYA